MEDDCAEVEIREAAASDAAEILAVQKLAFHGQGLLYNDLRLPPLVQTLDELIRDVRVYAYLVAKCRDRIVGSVRGRVEGNTCFISRLIVHPEHQNRGIGKKLMQAIEDRFNEVERYELFTGHKSAKNLVLYSKLGYRRFGEKRQSDAVTLICLEKYRKGNLWTN